MKLGFDIDSTINEAYKYDIIHGKELCTELGLKPTIKVDEIDIRKMFGFDDSVYEKYMSRYFSWSVKNGVPCVGAPEVLRRLSQKHIICIVTARREEYDKGEYKGWMMKRDTYRWFEKYNIHPHEWYFSSTNKSEVCKKNGIDVLVDDDPKHIEHCLETGMPIIVKAQPYNAYLKSEAGILYANTWFDIEKFINQLSQIHNM